MPCGPQMPSSWLSSGCDLSQLYVAANPQGSAYFHSLLHYFKSDPLSLGSKHVLVSSLGFGPPQSNTSPLLLVFCPSIRQEQENRDKMSKTKFEKEIHMFTPSHYYKIFCSEFLRQKPHVWSPSRWLKIHSLFSQYYYIFFWWIAGLIFSKWDIYSQYLGMSHIDKQCQYERYFESCTFLAFCQCFLIVCAAITLFWTWTEEAKTS